MKVEKVTPQNIVATMVNKKKANCFGGAMWRIPAKKMESSSLTVKGVETKRTITMNGSWAQEQATEAANALREAGIANVSDKDATLVVKYKGRATVTCFTVTDREGVVINHSSYVDEPASKARALEALNILASHGLLTKVSHTILV